MPAELSLRYALSVSAILLLLILPASVSSQPLQLRPETRLSDFTYGSVITSIPTVASERLGTVQPFARPLVATGDMIGLLYARDSAVYFRTIAFGGAPRRRAIGSR